MTIKLVKTKNNGGCGECACACHTNVPVPGPHIATCKFADPNYVPPDWPEAATKASEAWRREVLGGGKTGN